MEEDWKQGDAEEELITEDEVKSMLLMLLKYKSVADISSNKHSFFSAKLKSEENRLV